MLRRCSASRASFWGRRALCCRHAHTIIRTAAAQHNQSASSTQFTASSHPLDVTIVGGGAAGLTAAFFAAEHGARVTVLERTREAGKKILMSGGSRCNVLPLEVDLQTDYFSESSPSAVRAVFASWNLDLCKSWLEDPYWGVGLDLQLEEETKKYFPSSNSAREVRDKLVAACLSRGVVFKYNASVEGLQLLQPEAKSEAQEAPEEALVAVDTPKKAASVAVGQTGGGAAPKSRAAAIRLPGDGVVVLEQAAAGDGNVEEAASQLASDVAAGPANPLHTSGAASGDVSSGGGGGGDGKGGVAAVVRRSKRGRGPRSGGVVAGAEAEAEAVACGAEARVRWLCRLRDGSEHVTDKLIIATGGLSFPAVGTDGTGHRLIRTLGHTLHEPYPALTPLTGPHPAGEQLAGVSMYGIELSVQVPGVRKPKISERTALLFTHRGYSGPAVLDLSHHAVKALTRGSSATLPLSQRPNGTTSTAAPVAGGRSGGGGDYVEMDLPSIRVNWTHEPAAVWDERIRAGGTALVTTLLQRHGLRERLAEALVSELGLTGRRVCDVKKAERAALVSALTSYELPYHGHEGYKKAEVTGGGVRLEELNCATMESRLLPNLYLCGEIVDVFGRIGGFNFYWAWVSGRLAGIGAAQGGLRPRPTAKTAAAASTTTTTSATTGPSVASNAISLPRTAESATASAA